VASYQERLDRQQQEWSVRELKKRGELHTVKGISPEMDKRVRNAERRVARKDKKS
jgi:hypothetical protein